MLCRSCSNISDKNLLVYIIEFKFTINPRKRVLCNVLNFIVQRKYLSKCKMIYMILAI